MNNDRFKFRVFDNEHGEYVRNSHYDRFFCILWDGRLWETEYREPNDSSMTADASRYIVELCTGLRDKNGKLIYEGDVVKRIYDMFGRENYIFLVVWCQGKMVLLFSPNAAPVLVWDSLDFEVVGNIHEVKHE